MSPLGDRVLVKPQEVESKTAGGILLAPSGGGRSMQDALVGTGAPPGCLWQQARSAAAVPAAPAAAQLQRRSTAGAGSRLRRPRPLRFAAAARPAPLLTHPPAAPRAGAAPCPLQ